MASASDFKKLGTIRGVIGYLLVREDGHTIVYQTSNAEKLSSIIVASGTNCRQIEEFLSGGQFSHLCIERKDGNDLLIFSLGKYFLWVEKADDINSSMIVESITNFLKTL